MTIADRAVLVTGANRGIGQALVAEALRRGAGRVYAGTRQPLAHPDGRVTPLRLDATNTVQIQAAATWKELLALLDEGGPEELLPPGPRRRSRGPRRPTMAQDQAQRRRHRRLPGPRRGGKPLALDKQPEPDCEQSSW